MKNIKGLSSGEVSERFKRDGYNELASSQRRGVLKIVFEVLKEPMFILLVICGALYLILGDIGEAVMLLGFVFVVMGITIYQEGKAEKAIEALRDLSSPRALVIRDGIQKRIPGREVVKDDIILVREGDRVPADAVLLWGINMTADESLLTGESIPVRKKPGGDDSPFVFSGTLIVQGQGIAKVIATGMNTEMGKIGTVLSSVEEEQTFLQKETGKLVKSIFIAAIVLCLLAVAAYRLTRGDWLHGILSGITLAMAMLPEEFPVVLTIFLALGAWRLSKNNVLTRKVSAVEILGSSTVLCVDKTGTLTQNKMSIKKIFNGREFFGIESGKERLLPEPFHKLVEFGILASKIDPFDPMEKALEELGRKALYDTEHIHLDWPLIEEYPLSEKMLALSHVWKKEGGEGYLIAAKGAPEAIADLCHLGQKEKEDLSKNIYIMASEGLRVLGVAASSFERQRLPGFQHDFDFKFIGLIGLADPVRDNVPDALNECYGAGIRVVMITGDYPVTAQRIAKEIGLKYPDKVITGSEIEKMSPEELREKIREVNIFSRVAPEQKLLIVDALKANGETVAMTGDGVNDAPALKSAHIGIAMGERGTDVARESSDIVLLNDDFFSIVEAVRIGRRIFDNLKKAMAYIISVHVPIAGSSLIPILFGWPIILYPVHIVFLELIIDPACSVVFESEPAEKNIMNRSPRDPKEPLFGKKMLSLSLLQGLFSLIVVITVFKTALRFGQAETGARTLAFITLIVSNICLILTNRSWSRTMLSSFSVSNKALIIVIAGAVIFLSAVLYTPFLQKLFHFGSIHAADILMCLTAGILSVIWFEFLKFIFNKIGVDLMR
ncbi:MAG: cation-translocating P-type ATPase [Candidatus Omnitrophota bacterium]